MEVPRHPPERAHGVPHPWFLQGLLSTGTSKHLQDFYPQPCMWISSGGQGSPNSHGPTCLGGRDFSISAPAPEHLAQPRRGCGGTGQLCPAQLLSLPGLFLLLQPRPRCPACRDAINHYGDCCKPQLGSEASWKGIFPLWCAESEGKGRFFPPC